MPSLSPGWGLANSLRLSGSSSENLRPCKEIACKEICIAISWATICKWEMYLNSGGMRSQSSGKFTLGRGQDGQRTANSPARVAKTPAGSWPHAPHFKSFKCRHCMFMWKRVRYRDFEMAMPELLVSFSRPQ